MDAVEEQLSRVRVPQVLKAKSAKAYGYYRKLLEDAKSYDAVLIATGDRWHALASILAMRAGTRTT